MPTPLLAVTSDPCQHTIHRFQHRHLLAELGEYRSRLEADIPATDHHDILHFRRLGQHAVSVSTSADVVDTHEIASRTAQATRRTASCPDQLAIANAASVGEHNILLRRIDGHNPSQELQLDIAFGPECLRSNENSFEALFA